VVSPWAAFGSLPIYDRAVTPVRNFGISPSKHKRHTTDCSVSCTSSLKGYDLKYQGNLRDKQLLSTHALGMPVWIVN